MGGREGSFTSVERAATAPSLSSVSSLTLLVLIGWERIRSGMKVCWVWGVRYEVRVRVGSKIRIGD